MSDIDNEYERAVEYVGAVAIEAEPQVIAIKNWSE